MLDLNKLEEQREEATIDKADLFDFYHKNWKSLVNEIKELRSIDHGDPRQKWDVENDDETY